MIRSIRKAITKVSNGEKIEDFIAGVEGVKRTITEIWPEVATDVILRAYLGQDRIVEVHLECDAATYLGVPVDLEVPVGKTFKAGFLDEAGNTNVVDLTVFYREEPA